MSRTLKDFAGRTWQIVTDRLLVDFWTRIRPRLNAKIGVIPPVALFTIGWVADGITTFWALVMFPEGVFVENNPTARWVQSNPFTWILLELGWPTLAVSLVRRLRIRHERAPEGLAGPALVTLLMLLGTFGLSNLRASLQNLGQLDLAWKMELGR